MKKLFFLALLSLTSLTAYSQSSSSLETEEYLLDGMSFTFQYQNGGAIDASFANGQITYKWIAGRNSEEPIKTYPYKSRKIDSEIFLVSWHEMDSKNYVTMVYNFKSNTCSASLISNYGSDNPFLGFQAGIIEHVNIK